jgi:hypothetical protein
MTSITVTQYHAVGADPVNPTTGEPGAHAELHRIRDVHPGPAAFGPPGWRAHVGGLPGDRLTRARADARARARLGAPRRTRCGGAHSWVALNRGGLGAVK